MEPNVNKTKKFLAILSAVILICFLGWNVYYFQKDPLSFYSAIIFLILLGGMWVAALWSGTGGFGSSCTIGILVVILTLSGGAFVIETLGLSTPLATIQIDNSTTVMPWPKNPSPKDREIIQWMDKKVRIEWSEMFSVVLIGKIITTSALWTGMIITLLSMAVFNMAAKNITWWPKKLRYISVPMEFLILATMIVSMYWVLPAKFGGLDSISKQGLRISWLLGFTQNWWYLGIIALIAKGIERVEGWTNTANEKYEESGKSSFKVLTNLGFVFSGLTFMWYEIITLTISPASVVMKVCGDLIMSSPITNTMCFQSYQHGILFFTFISAVYVWIAIRIKKFFKELVKELTNE